MKIFDTTRPLSSLSPPNRSSSAPVRSFGAWALCGLSFVLMSRLGGCSDGPSEASLDEHTILEDAGSSAGAPGGPAGSSGNSGGEAGGGHGGDSGGVGGAVIDGGSAGSSGTGGKQDAGLGTLPDEQRPCTACFAKHLESASAACKTAYDYCSAFEPCSNVRTCIFASDCLDHVLGWDSECLLTRCGPSPPLDAFWSYLATTQCDQCLDDCRDACWNRCGGQQGGGTYNGPAPKPGGKATPAPGIDPDACLACVTQAEQGVCKGDFDKCLQEPTCAQLQACSSLAGCYAVADDPSEQETFGRCPTTYCPQYADTSTRYSNLAGCIVAKCGGPCPGPG
jgi:hypothetical protein